MKNLFLLLLLTWIPCGMLTAQKKIETKKSTSIEKKGVLKYHEVTIGAQVFTNGWGIVAERNRIPSDRLKKIIQVNIFGTRSYKQYKSNINNSPYLSSNNNAFYYGKINNFYSVNVLWGWRQHWAWSARFNGVDMNFGYLIGPTLGITKGYALSLQYDRDDVRIETYDESNKDVFLDIYSIRGHAGFFKGWDKIGFYPGISSKVGLNFDLSSSNSTIKAIDFGVSCDVYYKDVPIMAITSNTFFYPKLYLSLQLGRRW